MKYIYLVFFVFSYFQTIANNTKDTLIESIKIKEPKHYFKPSLYFNIYSTPKRDIRVFDVSRGFRRVNRRELYRQNDAYQFTQANIGFNAPLFTRIKKKEDGSMSNTTYLLTGSLLSAKPYLSSLNTNHVIYRGSLGLRTLYSPAGKSIWYFDLFGFASEDNKSIKIPSPRFGATIILNRTVNEYFSYRVGLTRTFMFGSKYYLPIFGLRVGRLDGLNLSMQLPKNVSLNIPVSSRSAFSLFFKPFGGIYNFKNTDSLFNRRASIIQFRRLDYLLGGAYSATLSDNFSFNIASGFASGGFSFADNKFITGDLSPFYRARADVSLFINAGFCFSFGKVKKSDNNIKLMDMKDLNTTNDPGDINLGSGENQSRKNRDVKSLSNIKYKDVEDLINDADF